VLSLPVARHRWTRPAFTRYSIYLPRRDGKLSWPRQLVTYRDGLPARRQSPIQVLTRPGVEQLRWSGTTRYRYTTPLTEIHALQTTTDARHATHIKDSRWHTAPQSLRLLQDIIFVLLPVISLLCRFTDWVHTDVGLSLSLARWRGTHYRDICVILFTPYLFLDDYLRHFSSEY